MIENQTEVVKNDVKGLDFNLSIDDAHNILYCLELSRATLHHMSQSFYSPSYDKSMFTDAIEELGRCITTIRSKLTQNDETT